MTIVAMRSPASVNDILPSTTEGARSGALWHCHHLRPFMP
jgi:hypothetical protein